MALSSNCTADPFTADGTTCAPAAVNAAFDTFTTAGSPQRLYSQALTGGPNCVLFYQCGWTSMSTTTGRSIIAKLRQRYFVGIIVDKVGKHGSLKRVGRVPLGTHPRSTLHLAWDLSVNGKPLKAGHYRVTLRAIDKKGEVLGLTRPVDLRVKGWPGSAGTGRVGGRRRPPGCLGGARSCRRAGARSVKTVSVRQLGPACGHEDRIEIARSRRWRVRRRRAGAVRRTRTVTVCRSGHREARAAQYRAAASGP